MIQSLCNAIGRQFPLTALDCGKYSVRKISGMTFHISAFRAQGLGHVSVMTAKGFFGLMNMDTLIINPTELDLPLFSYDRVLAMGNDTLIFELYDTMLGTGDLAALEQVKANARDLPDHDLGRHWYDDIKLPVSLSKKGKKPHRAGFDRCAEDYLAAFLRCAAAAGPCDPDAKREKASVYVEGLLTNGGPSTDVFKKGLGQEQTQQLFRSILFGTKL